MKAEPIVIDDRVAITCTECEIDIPVPIVVTMAEYRGADIVMSAEPDLDGLWDHWNMVHGPQAEG